MASPNSFQKSQKIASTALGLLLREQKLLGLVTPYTRTDFQYALNDTITVPVRAITQARSFALRAEGEDRKIIVDHLTETSVPVKLDTVVYNAIGVTDEELTLDVADFSAQVVAPQVTAVTEKVESMIYGGMKNSPYAPGNTIAWDAGSNAYKMAMRARKILNKRNVPETDRVLLIGPDVEESIATDSRLEPGINPTGFGAGAIAQGSVLGRLAGFLVVTSNLIPATEAYAFHKTAFAFGNVAPVVPQGAKFGAVKSYNGVSVRWIMDYSADYGVDRSVLTTYGGVNSTIDPNADNKQIRAVKINVTGADSDINDDDAPVVAP